MSVEAITWALKQPVKPSSTKFVLVVLANCADQNFFAWPSTTYLCTATSQDRKTVLENMKRLRDLGYIADTGMRKGGTGSVPVYQLRSPENGTASAEDSGGEDPAAVPKTGHVSGSENGTGSETEAVPFFPSSGTVFPMKQSRFSHEAVPKTGHRTVKEPSKEPSRNRHNSAQNDNGTENGTAFVLPDWIPKTAWEGYLDMRQKKRKPPTPHARDLVIAELAKLRAKGQNVEEVLNQSIRNTWTDVYPLKQQSQRTDQQQKSLDEINAEAFRLAFPNRGRTIDG